MLSAEFKEPVFKFSAKEISPAFAHVDPLAANCSDESAAIHYYLLGFLWDSTGNSLVQPVQRYLPL